MALTLYTFVGNFRAFKILIAAEYNGVAIDVPPFEMMKDNKTPEFLAMSPMGKVPVLKTPQGALFESNAIARYVARMRRDTELCGASFYESGQVDSWIDFCTHELELSATMWLYPVIGYMSYNEAATNKAKADLKVALGTLDKHLMDKSYLVGHKITLADITVATTLVYPFKLLCDAEYRKAFPNVMRWFNTCVNQEEFKAVIGEVVLCSKELLPANASAASTPAANKKDNNKKDNKGGSKKEKKAKEQQPKQEKKKKEKAPEQPKPKKVEHPFKIMDREQPTEFNMDAWKKIYSNCGGDYKGAMDQFWNLYDAAGWSIWTGRYKYNNENERSFMTSNLMNSFIQRSGEIRKWLFGVMWVTGEDKVAPLEVSGCYFIRGQSIQPLMDANDDAEHYNWYKVDVSTDEGKALVFEMWCSADGSFEFLEGKPCIACTEFK